MSTSTRTRGGVAAYVRTMQQTPLWERWSIHHVVTHRSGSAARRIVTFALGTGVFLREMTLRRPSLVHLHTASYGSFARKATLAWVARVLRVPTVVHVHGGAFAAFHDGSPRLVQRVIRRTLEEAGAVIALGDSWAASLQRIAPGARVRVVSNAVAPAGRVAQPREGESVHVLFLGDVEEHKGAFLLLEAWSRLGDEGRLADLTLAGGGAVSRARQEVAALGLTDSVRVLGHVQPEQVEDLLSQAHVLVLPSLFEGQPMAILEAMAHGLCVVATDVGGIPDLVADCGVLVPVSDVAALVDALHAVVTDPVRRAELGERAFRRVLERFDVNQTWKLVDALYAELTT